MQMNWGIAHLKCQKDGLVGDSVKMCCRLGLFELIASPELSFPSLVTQPKPL